MLEAVPVLESAFEANDPFMWHLETDRVNFDVRRDTAVVPMILMTPDGTRFLRMNATTSLLETVPVAGVESPDHMWVMYPVIVKRT